MQHASVEVLGGQADVPLATGAVRPPEQVVEVEQMAQKPPALWAEQAESQPLKSESSNWSTLLTKGFRLIRRFESACPSCCLLAQAHLLDTPWFN